MPPDRVAKSSKHTKNDATSSWIWSSRLKKNWYFWIPGNDLMTIWLYFPRPIYWISSISLITWLKWAKYYFRNVTPIVFTILLPTNFSVYLQLKTSLKAQTWSSSRPLFIFVFELCENRIPKIKKFAPLNGIVIIS